MLTKLNQKIILYKLVEGVIDQYKDVYYELDKANSFITRNLKMRKKNFRKPFQ